MSSRLLSKEVPEYKYFTCVVNGTACMTIAYEYISGRLFGEKKATVENLVTLYL
jgi:hypothetical protein